jgi:hypothetical protein
VLNWNRGQDTIPCLESVRRLDYRNYIVIVVDNGSKDDSVQVLRSWFSANIGVPSAFADYSRSQALGGGVRSVEESFEKSDPTRRYVLIRNEENLGFAGGHNVAIRYALGRPQPAEYVFLLNNDATLHPECLTRLVETAKRTAAGVVGTVQADPRSGRVLGWGAGGSVPLLRQFFQPLIPRCTVAPAKHAGFWPAFWVGGTAMLVTGETLAGIEAQTGRYLDDSLFLYWEELEFCSTARRTGHESVVCASAICYHDEATSTGGRFNPIAYYYSNRNRMLLASRLLPFVLRLPFHALNLVATAGRVLKMVWAGRYYSAAAIWSGWLDGFDRKTGKWKNHDQALVGRR